MLRRIAGRAEPDTSTGASEESKGNGTTGSRDNSILTSDQLLEAVNDILGRADMSLTMEQGDQLKESLRLKGMGVMAYDSAVCHVLSTELKRRAALLGACDDTLTNDDTLCYGVAMGLRVCLPA